jgi:hypothetical protein
MRLLPLRGSVDLPSAGEENVTCHYFSSDIGNSTKGSHPCSDGWNVQQVGTDPQQTLSPDHKVQLIVAGLPNGFDQKTQKNKEAISRSAR